MTEYLDRWVSAGIITPEQHRALTALVRRERLSVFLELNALLYVAVLAFAGGLAWTANTYSAQWGDAAILVPATALLGGCLYYCFSRATPYSRHQVHPDALAFDYVLYLACLIFGVELGYVEYRFNLLQGQWDYYLLASALLYFALAYRFDNRFVLSLAIATLGGWFGVRLTAASVFQGNALRMSAVVYGVLVCAAGWSTYVGTVKRHFLETYLHVGVNALLGGLLAGVVDGAASALWILALLVAVAAVIAGGVVAKRFAFVVYGTLYGYVGVMSQLLPDVHDATAALMLIVVSAGVVIVTLVVLARRFGNEG